MKYLLIILAFILGIFAYDRYQKHRAAATDTANKNAIPNTAVGFAAAVAAGDITFKLTSGDPFGIYDRNGQRIGYWTTGGSVYTVAGTLVLTDATYLKMAK